MGAPRPGWLRDHLLFILSILDLGGKRLSSTSSRDAGTCGESNMSVRVDVVRELGGFDTQFGSRPESPMDRGEDQDLQRRLAAVGYETWYEPSMVAHHYVPPERLTEAYFEAQLRTRAKAEAREAGGPARVLDRFVRSAIRYALEDGRASRRTLARLELTYGWSVIRARAKGI